MRDLIITENITLDGVIDAAEGWFMPAGDEDTDQSDVIAALAEQREAADAFLTGRLTFEQMRGFWPQQTDDETGVSDYLNRVEKYVVSTTLEDPGWEPTTILRGLDDVRALKRRHGADIVVTGSLTLVPDLIAAGVVDEYRLFVHPVVLGRGQRLFQDATDVPRLELVEARPFASGIVLMRYRPLVAGCAPPPGGGGGARLSGARGVLAVVRPRDRVGERDRGHQRTAADAEEREPRAPRAPRADRRADLGRPVAEHLHLGGGGDEDVRDRAAVGRRERRDDRAAALGEQDVAVQRRGLLELGEPVERRVVVGLGSSEGQGGGVHVRRSPGEWGGRHLSGVSPKGTVACRENSAAERPVASVCSPACAGCSA